ncbi:MAG TPA: InlB B-repeat-containing protein, partial [Thermotogota bacterium]|nr:InlB B-repeat-containing protein [Thermotogota bacterium]
MKTISRGKKPFLLSMISFIAVMLMIVGCGGGGGTGPVVPDTQQPIIHEMKYEGEAGTDITSDSRAAAQGTLYVKASDNQTQSNQLTFDIKNGNGSFTSYTVTKGNDGYYVKEVAMRPQNIYERGNFDGFDATARVRDASGNGTLEKRFFDLALSEQAGRQAITEAKDNVPISGFDTAGGFAEDQQVDIQGRNVSVDLVGHFTGGDSGWRELSVKYYNINDTEDAAFQNIVFNQGNVRIARYSYLGGNNRGYFVWLETNLNYSTSKDTLEAALNFIKTDSGLEDDDVTLTAQASPASGGDVRINSGMWGDSKNVTVNSGTQVTLQASAVSGYTFEGWYDGSVKVSSNTTYQVTATANKTYKANFTQNASQYTITAQASPASGGDVRINSGTWGDSKSVTVNSGTQVTLQASAVSGYTFEGWYDGSVKVSSNTTYQVTATANKTYKANFTQNAAQYTITAQASPASGGDVRINSGTWGDSKNVTVNSGTQVTLEASAVSGYTFEGWYDGSVKVSSNTTYQVTATANKTYKANFTQNATQYTITAQASPASGGDVRVNSGTWGDDKSVIVNSGTQVTLEASAVSGYT